MKKCETEACPCGAGIYAGCCGRFIEGVAQAESAEQLMRSRYTAYTLGKEAYLQQSWHPTTRPAGQLTEPGTKWLGLEVRRHEQQGDRAMVEFVARYKVGGRAYRMHEISRFVREEGKWYYVEGSFPENNDDNS